LGFTIEYRVKRENGVLFNIFPDISSPLLTCIVS